MRSTRPQIVRFALVAVAAALASMHVPVSAADATQPVSFNPHNFKVPAGVYRCELDRRVEVRQVSQDMQTAVLQFNKKEYRLKAVLARSGALRYEDEQSGVVWLVIATKSMLLDTKNGRQLANECRT